MGFRTFPAVPDEDFLHRFRFRAPKPSNPATCTEKTQEPHKKMPKKNNKTKWKTPFRSIPVVYSWDSLFLKTCFQTYNSRDNLIASEIITRPHSKHGWCYTLIRAGNCLPDLFRRVRTFNFQRKTKNEKTKNLEIKFFMLGPRCRILDIWNWL